jgi:hypothetical protein
MVAMLVVFVSLSHSAPSLGQTFACTQRNAGQLSVQAEVQCACRFEPESRMAGTPAGYRWDCGILRARMNQDVPATANPYPYQLPTALSLDRTIVQQGQADGGPSLPDGPELGQ